MIGKLLKNPYSVQFCFNIWALRIEKIDGKTRPYHSYLSFNLFISVVVEKFQQLFWDLLKNILVCLFYMLFGRFVDDLFENLISP